MNKKQLAIFKSQWKTGTTQIAGLTYKPVSKVTLKDFNEGRVEAVWSPTTRRWMDIQFVLNTLPSESEEE